MVSTNINNSVCGGRLKGLPKYVSTVPEICADGRLPQTNVRVSTFVFQIQLLYLMWTMIIFFLKRVFRTRILRLVNCKEKCGFKMRRLCVVKWDTEYFTFTYTQQAAMRINTFCLSVMISITRIGQAAVMWETLLWRTTLLKSHLDTMWKILQTSRWSVCGLKWLARAVHFDHNTINHNERLKDFLELNTVNEWNWKCSHVILNWSGRPGWNDMIIAELSSLTDVNQQTFVMLALILTNDDANWFIAKHQSLNHIEESDH